MPIPVDARYAVASGKPIYGGLWPGGRLGAGLTLADIAYGGGFGGGAPTLLGAGLTLDDMLYGGGFGVAPPAAMVWNGDSLTDPSYGITSMYWANKLGLFKPIANVGVAGNTVADLVTRINNAYTNASPGLASLPEAVGIIGTRICTNNARSNAIGSSERTSIDTMVSTTASYITSPGIQFLFAVPPLGGPNVAGNVNVSGYNSYLASKANGTNIFFIDDCINLRDGSGNQLSQFFQSDGIHFSAQGTYQAGIDGAAAIATIMNSLGYGFVSGLVTDPADVYPAFPQWVPHPTMAGTSGTVGSGFTGTAPTGYAVNGNGSGYTGTSAIVAADVSDPNQTPWWRITPTAMGAAGSIQITFAAAGRTITTTDPTILETRFQMRFNSFDGSKTTGFRQWLQDSTGGKMTPYLPILVGGTVSDTIIARNKMKRPTNNNASGATHYLECLTAGSFTGSMGSFDIRCISNDG